MGGLPLAGLRVAVTRPAAGAADLAALLRAAGAVPLVLPLIRIDALPDPAQLRQAMTPGQPWDWAVFTSANAVRSVAGLVPDPSSAWRRVAVVGPATAAAAEQWLGRAVDAQAAQSSGEFVAEAMAAVALLEGATVFWPRAEHARPALRDSLCRAGALVRDVVAYRTVEDAGNAAKLHQLITSGAVDAVTFTSPSAVRVLAARGGIPPAIIVAVIGRTTAAAARAAGMKVHAQAVEQNMQSLVTALEAGAAG